MLKRIAGIIALVLGLLIYLLAGNGPLEGPVGLSVGLVGGTVFCIGGGVLIGKSVLDDRE